MHTDIRIEANIVVVARRAEVDVERHCAVLADVSHLATRVAKPASVTSNGRRIPCNLTMQDYMYDLRLGQ